ncbi:MAG: efflux RND transporter permease subunit [Pseudomonadota bacterium]
MSTLVFDNIRLLILTIAIILVGGLAALFTMPQEEDPKITNRAAVILTPFPGASAERVEKLVTEKLENELREIAEIDTIRSDSRTGLSSVTVVLKDQIYDTDGPFSVIRDAVTDASRQFPAGAATPIFNDDRGYAYTVMAALVWEARSAPNRLILKRIAEELQDDLRDVPGTELVTIHGAPSEEVIVSVDSAVLQSLGLDQNSVAAAIAGADSKVSAGRFRGTQNEYVLEVRGELDSLSRLRTIPLREDDTGAIVRLGDVAEVHRSLVTPPDDLAMVEGAPAVIVATRMETGLRVGDWSATVRDALAEFDDELSGGVRLEIVFDQAEYATARFGSLINNLLVGAGLVVLVLFVTLGWRSAIIVTAAIPLTGLAALIVLNIIGIPIHQMSITGLVVALGLLVDAAIVMTDAIRRRLIEGLSAREAVKASVERLWTPLLSSTLTTVLAFSPIALLPGGAGEFVGPISISVITALIASLALALTLGAALSGLFLPRALKNYVGRKEGSAPFWVSGISLPPLAWAFNRLLKASLRAPLVSMAIATLPAVVGFIGVTTLPTMFFPEADRNQFHIELRLPPQASIYETEEAVARATDILNEREDILSADWFLGASAPSFYYNMQMNQDGQSNYAEAMVTARSLRGLYETINSVQTELSASLPDVQVLSRQLLQGPPTFAPVELRIYGDDFGELQRIGEDVRRVFAKVPQVTHSYASVSGGRPKLWLDADEDAARQAGLSLVDIARSLDGQLEGALGGTVIEGAEELPVRVRLADEERAKFDELSSLTVLSGGGASGLVDFSGAPISGLGELKLEPSPFSVSHYNGARVNVVSVYVDAGALASVALANFQKLWAEEGYDLPNGYRFEIGGDEEARSTAVGNLVSSFGLIIMLMITTVVLTFNSFRISAIVFTVAVQAVGLGMLALTIAGFAFGFQPIIALIGLIGVAINAAIIILSGLQKDPRAMAGDLDAVREGVGETARHITSTTITTFGGFLPLLLSEGGFWPPFATVIAGGVLLSTATSFFFVPQAFVLVRKLGGVRVTSAAPATA